MLNLLAHFLSIKGRAGRLEFWLFHLAYILMSCVPLVVLFLLVKPGDGVYWPLDISQLQISPVLFGLLAFPMLLKSLLYFYMGITILFMVMAVTTTIRRLHDLNISGWWVVGYLGISFLIGAITALIRIYLPEIFVVLNEFFQRNKDIIGVILLPLHIAYFILAFCWPGTRTTNRYGRSEWEVNQYIKQRIQEARAKKARRLKGDV